MAIDSTMFSSDLLAIEGDIVQSFTFGGVSYPCVYGEIDGTMSLAMDGQYNDADRVIVARVAALTGGIPKVSNVVNVAGADMRVSWVQVSVDGVSVTLSLKDVRQ